MASQNGNYGTQHEAFKYDVYLSFNNADKNNLELFVSALAKQGVVVWPPLFDAENKHLNGKKERKTAIDSSKLVLVYISASYCNSLQCMDEFVYVNIINKPRFVLLHESVNQVQTLGDLGVYLSKVYNFYKLIKIEKPPAQTNAHEFYKNTVSLVVESLKYDYNPMRELQQSYESVLKPLGSYESKIKCALSCFHTIKEMHDFVLTDKKFEITNALVDEMNLILVDTKKTYFMKLDLNMLTNKNQLKLIKVDYSNVSNYVKEPSAYYFSEKADHYFIYDSKTHNVYLFRRNFHLKMIIGEKKLSQMSQMLLDEDNYNELYVLNSTKRRVECYDITSGNLIEKSISYLC
jgi:hypothetical protein